MSWESALRKIQAAQRREERESLRHQKELNRRLKEWAKLDLLQQAALEVETFDNAVEVLLSVHKEASSPMNWRSLTAK